MIITHRYKVDRRIIYKELRNRGISIKKSRIMRDWRINIINKYLEASNLLKIEHLAKNVYKRYIAESYEVTKND
jgi:hypothetical protein